MKIVKPDVEVMKHDCGLYEFVEKVGRVCYKSEDKIGEGTAEKFVNGLVKSNHMAMMEHEYLYFNFDNYNDTINFISRFLVPDSNSYTIAKYLNISEFYISGSVRAWREFFDNVHEISQVFEIGYDIYAWMQSKVNILYPSVFSLYEDWKYEWEEDYKIQLISRDEFINHVVETCSHPEMVFNSCLPHTLKFTVDRGVANELVRHRPASFAQSSTRFCNYSHGKFGREITVIDPLFFPKDSVEYKVWKIHCEDCERSYMTLIDNGAKPEEARSVLPNSLMTEIIITANEKEWQHILNLRLHGTTGRPHPQMEEIMRMAQPLLIEETGNRIS